MPIVSSCDITIGYFKVDNVPHSYFKHITEIPAEGGEFDFYLAEYVYDELWIQNHYQPFTNAIDID